MLNEKCMCWCFIDYHILYCLYVVRCSACSKFVNMMCCWFIQHYIIYIGYLTWSELGTQLYTINWKEWERERLQHSSRYQPGIFLQKSINNDSSPVRTKLRHHQKTVQIQKHWDIMLGVYIVCSVYGPRYWVYNSSVIIP